MIAAIVMCLNYREFLMPIKDTQDDVLSSNQEHIIAFLVIGLFGLMYWFFMHGDNSENDYGQHSLISSATAAVESNTSGILASNDLVTDNEKKDEIQARRDDAAALKLSEKANSQKTKLLLETSNVEALMRNKLSEMKAKLAAETKLKQEALRSLEIAEIERDRAEEGILRLFKEQNKKSKEVAIKLTESNKAVKNQDINTKGEIAAVKTQQDEKEAFEASNQKAELDVRIKSAQKILEQQEKDRLEYSLANGKVIKISADGFESKLKQYILNNITNQAIVFDKVIFASSSAELNNQSVRQIEGMASILQAYESKKVLLRGHTDNSGIESKNMALSLNRGMQIKKQLVSLGISPTRISVEGIGSQEPIANNETKLGRKENRRIDVMVLGQ